MKNFYLFALLLSSQLLFANNTKYDQIKLRSKQNTTSIARHRFIIDSLSKYWIGTKWDFNGTTETPNQGSIACGYFVTTLLRDAGYNVQRIKWAQAPSSALIKNTCTNLKRYNNLDQVKSYLNAMPEYTLCIVGLDFHTGFVYKAKGKYYMLHASWCTPVKVVVEEFNNCRAIQKNAAYYIGAIR